MNKFFVKATLVIAGVLILLIIIDKGRITALKLKVEQKIMEIEQEMEENEIK